MPNGFRTIVANTANWSRENLAWLAGLIEGEGCFSPTGKNQRVTVQMCDRDVLEKARRIAGAGEIYGPLKRSRDHHRPIYSWKITGRQDAYAVMVAIYQFMGARRRAAIEASIKDFARARPYQRKLCGTWSRYKAGCRCGACIDAMRVVSRRDATRRAA